MDPLWIDEAETLQRFCEKIDEGPLGVDTESDHFHAYQARICLIQLADGDREALVDPLALDAGKLTPLFELLEDPNIEKILHSARNDIREFDRDYGITINNLFDTQVAARFLDTERNSLTWMLEELAGVETGKAFKRFDWTTRPVPSKARRYAVDDVRYLGELRDRFERRLEEEGWLEPFAQQCDYIANSMKYDPSEFDPGDWRALDGSDKLDGRGRAALKDLFRWRHELCEEKNQSAVTLFPNGPLVSLAKQRPTTPSEVAETPGVPRRITNDYGEAIAEVIRESASTDAPPKNPPKEPHDPPSPEQRERYHALRKWRNRKAESLGIPTEFIATNDTISEIAENPPDTIPELGEFSPILPWHMDEMGDEMLGILHKTGN